MFGLLKTDLDEIIKYLVTIPEVEEAYVLGSRAKGNYHQGSDVDIALKGQDLSFSIISKISYHLNEESVMPYRFDVLNYHDISNEELLAHILRVGKLFYQKLAMPALQEPKVKYGKEKH